MITAIITEVNAAACQLSAASIITVMQVKATICRSFRKTKDGTLVRNRIGSRISTQGTYIASMKYFEPNQNCTMTQAELDEYIKAMKKIVAAKSTYSLQILELDYYRHIFDAGLTNTGS